MEFDQYITKLELCIGYEFKNKALIRQALTHPSYLSFANTTKLGVIHYERLEYLGDAILNFVISEILYDHFPDHKEGLLAKRRATLVCKNTLVLIANEIQLSSFLIMSPGEEMSGGRLNSTNLENTLEALIAAIYKDSSMLTVTLFIKKYWWKYIDSDLLVLSDPKSAVQEWAQKLGRAVPKYIMISTKGAPHSPIFEIELSVEKEEPINGIGKSKKEAERNAAISFLYKYNLENNILD